MADILSQEEIDALLEVVDDGGDAESLEKEEVLHQKRVTL